MSQKAESLLPTRLSLISRLRNCQDEESWRTFFKTYWKLIYSFAVRCGCTDAEAEEVVQETVISIARKMPEYRYDPAVCSFKGWLMHVTNWRVIDQIRKRPGRGASSVALDADAVKLVDEAVGSGKSDLELLWEQEWQKNLLDAALESVKRKTNPEHYQIFYLLVVKEHSPSRVASLLKVSVARVYLAKHRVGTLVQKEIKTLTRKLL
jgi:RNA polymerase sigma-70 factor (ECF subfamily)